MRNPLTTEDHRHIHEAAARIEERTGYKIAIVITRASDRYTLYTVAMAAIVALTAGGVAVSARPALTGRTLIFVELCALVVLTVALDFLPIRLKVVPARIKQASARNLAHREFAAHLMGDGPHRMRILLFVSLAERYVEIIADHATHALAPAGTWNRIVDEFVAAVKFGRLADGVFNAIEACGEVLPAHSEGPKSSQPPGNPT